MEVFVVQAARQSGGVMSKDNATPIRVGRINHLCRGSCHRLGEVSLPSLTFSSVHKTDNSLQLC